MVDVQPGGRDDERGRSMMAEDVNAAVRGALAAGAHEILVHDAHGPTCDLRPEDPHPRAACAQVTERDPSVSEATRTVRRRSTTAPTTLLGLPGVTAEDGGTIRTTGQPPPLYCRFGVRTRGRGVADGAGAVPLSRVVHASGVPSAPVSGSAGRAVRRA
ncbi:M55 family metallopeptidase [Streptomyces murinus]|uniref:M55 family metallopeptidase n=1 Tax=Streptomyces murinus TaxID=33900 RepID=UPI001FC93A28|nr:M55 family metallopeptidase [Streptomyces murinus]